MAQAQQSHVGQWTARVESARLLEALDRHLETGRMVARDREASLQIQLKGGAATRVPLRQPKELICGDVDLERPDDRARNLRCM